MADTVAPPDWAKTWAAQLLVTLVVPTVKFVLVLPAETITALGRISGGGQGGFCELEIKTSLPPDGAGEAIVTVAVELLPPVTVVGFRRMEVTAMPGVRVRVAC